MILDRSVSILLLFLQLFLIIFVFMISSGHLCVECFHASLSTNPKMIMYSLLNKAMN